MSKGIFQIDGLAGYRIEVVGYSHLDGYESVTSIVADTSEEAEAELAELLTDEAYEDWEELYSAPGAVWVEPCFLRDAAEAGVRLR